MRNMFSSRLRQSACLLVLVVLSIGTVSVVISGGNGQTSQIGEDPTALSYRAFSAIAQVYRTGEEAGDLVERLNGAVSLLEEGRARRSSGDEAGALTVEAQARSMIEQVLSEVPVAQQRAESQSFNRTLVVIASIPPAILLSTLAFVVGLNVWRRYERSRLFEMRIVEGNAED